MFHVPTAINWLSVLLAFIACFGQGAPWYLLFFPKLYRVLLGKEKEPAIGQNQPLRYWPGSLRGRWR